MNSDHDQVLRQQLIQAMNGNQSHLDFKAVIDDFSFEMAGLKPEGAPHTAWQLVEHMRIALLDILEFSRNPAHKSPKWPEGYWPASDVPRDKQAWQASIKAYQEYASEMDCLISDPRVDLFQPVEGGTGQTLLREALVVAAHNSYHLGQLAFLKKALTCQ